MSTLSTVISLATAGYLVYSQIQQQKKNENLAKQLAESEDENAANFARLKREYEESLKNNRGYIDPGQMQCSIDAKVSSIISKPWNMAVSITIKNKSSYNKDIEALLLNFYVDGILCDWGFWRTGQWVLKSNEEITIKLYSVNSKVLFKDKADRDAVKALLKQKSTYTASIGCSTPIVGNLLILQKPYGYSTPVGVICEDVDGELTYDSYGLTFSGASNKNGNDLDELQDWNEA